jgi:hypothetical protein
MKVVVITHFGSAVSTLHVTFLFVNSDALESWAFLKKNLLENGRCQKKASSIWTCGEAHLWVTREARPAIVTKDQCYFYLAKHM